MGYLIYRELIKRDVENNVVPVEIMRMAKDPTLAFVNIIEKVVESDI